MIRLQLILVALVAGFFAHSVRGAERPQHHFLFIIDSSSSMVRHKPAAIRLIREVIGSGFEQQVEAGDSVDIWTYDTEKNLHGFPPQIWQPGGARRISDAAAVYVEKYGFKGKSDFSNVANDLNILVPQTKGLLVIVITDGETPFSGIHLDLDINGYLAKKGRLGPAQDPFLISMCAINGTLRTWTAHFGKGQPDLATLPERPGLKAAGIKIPEASKVASAAAGQGELKSPAKPVAKAQQVAEPARRSGWSPTPSPLIASPNRDFIFNFPPGTRITPMEPPAAKELPSAKPLAVLAAEKLKKARENPPASTGATNVAAPAVKPVQLESSAQKSNAVVSATPSVQTSQRDSPALVATNPTNPTNAVRLVVTASPVAGSSVAKLASGDRRNEKTNGVLVSAIGPTNSVVSSAGSGSAMNLGVAVARVKTDDKPKSGSAAGSGLGAQHSLQRAIYASGTTGLVCISLGGFLLYRRLRRPNQSIISRSLLQR
jgi:hypothetical protein